jgi:RimJ/RimL family protein N-acetyltransferase
MDSTSHVILVPDGIHFALNERWDIKEICYYNIYKSIGTDQCGYCYLIVNDGKPSHMGNIGFHIDEHFRRNGFATSACRQLLEIAKSKGMQTLYIAFNLENIVTKKICDHLGGLLEGTIMPETDLELCSKTSLLRYIYRFDL